MTDNNNSNVLCRIISVGQTFVSGSPGPLWPGGLAGGSAEMSAKTTLKASVGLEDPFPPRAVGRRPQVLSTQLLERTHSMAVGSLQSK